MSALVRLSAHFLDVLLDVRVLSKVSLYLSRYVGTAVKRGPRQCRVKLRRHRDGRLYHTPTIPGYSFKPAPVLNLRLDLGGENKLQAESKTVRTVRLTELKRFALETLPAGALRDDILSQPDEIPQEEFLANCRVWQRLVRII